MFAIFNLFKVAAREMEESVIFLLNIVGKPVLYLLEMSLLSMPHVIISIVIVIGKNALELLVHVMYIAQLHVVTIPFLDQECFMYEYFAIDITPFFTKSIKRFFFNIDVGGGSVSSLI